MVALREEFALLKLPKMSSYVLIVIFVSAIFVISIAGTIYSYYLIPRPAYLRILHTYSHQMVSEVASDFKTWYKENYGRSIEVTMALSDPQTAYKKVTALYINPEAEIWWGGPLSLFEKAYDSLVPYNSTYKSEINATCQFCPLMDLSHSTPYWYAASLYGLGVMYNENALRSLNLLVPQTWADLLKEEYEGGITMVDPTKSEFTQPFITLIIQSKNWIKGWEFLVRLSTFIKKYDNNEDDSALKVASGYMLLAILPDFYAYDKIVIYPKLNFTYLNATVLQPDPIAIIARGTYLDEARAFIDYVLTQRAQSIIGKYRLPIRQDVTPSSPRINPFAPNFPYIHNYNKTFQEIGKEIVKDYYQAWIAERHEEIKTAWKEIADANKTKHVNLNATHYYNLAWNNFTYVGYYNRTEIDTIYNKTRGWTENTTSYITEWRNASTNTYHNAIENAKKSKQAARTSSSDLMQRNSEFYEALYAKEVSFRPPSKNKRIFPNII